ncbi:S-layer homology domain-containing protein [Leucobacter sp.]
MYPSSLERPGTRWRVPAIGIVVALVLSLVSAVSAPLAHAAEGDRTISGVVALPEGFDAELLAGVRVTARTAADADPAADAATVGDDGAYAITGLEPGAYLVEFSAAGVAAGVLEGQAYGATEERPEGTPVDVSAGSRDDVNATLEAVVGAAEEIPAEVDASIEDPAALEEPGGDDAVAEEIESREDSGALPRAELVDPADLAEDPASPVQGGTVTETEEAGAEAIAPLEVAASEDGGPIANAATGNRSISGKVSLEAGSMASVRIYLENVDSSSGSSSRYLNHNNTSIPAAQRDTWNASTGQFSFRNLASGRYRISFEYWGASPVIVERWYPNALDRSAAKAVDVRKGNATGINGSLKRGIALKGNITTPAGVNKNTSSLYVTNAKGDLWLASWNRTANTYETPALPAGDYWVQLVGNTASYKLDSMQFLKSGSATKFTPPLGGVLTRNLTGANPNASIVGKVYVTGGLPKDFLRAANVYQVLDGVHFPLYYAWQNYEGPYLSLGLVPGDYKVEFTAKTGRDVAKGEWWNKKSTRAQATVVKLTSGQKKTGVNGTLRTGSSGQVSPFKDVKTNHKFYNEIAWMFHSGTSTGTRRSDGRYYYPKQSVTREAMAAFMYRMNAPASYKPLAKSPFADVSTRHKFYKEISWMYTSGLSTGIKKGGARYYDPKTAVSREAMAAFMFRQYAPSSYTKPGYSRLTDVGTGHKFFKEISWMYDSGLSTGVRNGWRTDYQPKNAVTREAMAAFLFRNALNN